MPVSKTEIKQIVTKNDYLQGQKGNWLSYWQDLANFCLPRKAWITTMKMSGEQLKFNFLYDSKPLIALNKSAAGFHSNLTNPASLWFDFRTLDEKFMQTGNAQRYFKEVNHIQYHVINNSNWNETMLEYYTDDLCFGSTCMATEEDYKTHVRYTSIPLEQINVELDERGDLLTINRVFKYTALQCKYKFGEENLSPEMKKAILADKTYQKFDVLHHVGPRYNRDVTKQDYFNMEFQSCWIAKEEEHLLAERGYTSMPYDFERFWARSDDEYGYSPAMCALASIKLANAQKRTLIRKAMKDADPASMSPGRFWIAPLNMNPNAMNYYDRTKYSKEDFSAIPSGGNPSLAAEMMEMEERIIEDAFFLPLFQTLSNVNKQMTVPEVQKRVADNLSLVGPVVGRMVKGISRSQLRTYEILNRRKLFPPPPKEIQGADLNLVFLGPLAKAQRSSELTGVMTWLGLLNQAGGLAPDIRDKFNGDRFADGTADLLNVDPSYVREQNKVDEIRLQNMALKQQQMQMEASNVASTTTKDLAQAKKANAEAAAV